MLRSRAFVARVAAAWLATVAACAPSESGSPAGGGQAAGGGAAGGAAGAAGGQAGENGSGAPGGEGGAGAGGRAGGAGGGGRMGGNGGGPDAGTQPDLAPGADPEPGRLAGITRLHNAVRAGVGVPPLAWDATIATTAAAWAEQCSWMHSRAPGLGENLAAFAPPQSGSAQKTVGGWADEVADYDYAANTCASGKQCGHYTQVVWSTSQRLGCAVNVCSTGSPFPSFSNWEIWVCNYSPAGNIVGRKPY